jgi:hypothetical protein
MERGKGRELRDSVPRAKNCLDAPQKTEFNQVGDYRDCPASVNKWRGTCAVQFLAPGVAIQLDLCCCRDVTMLGTTQRAHDQLRLRQ